MAKTHYGSVVRMSRQLEIVREGIFLDRKRVIARGFEILRQICVDPFSVVSDTRKLPVPRTNVRSFHPAPVCLADALVSQANPEHRHPGSEFPDRLHRHAAVRRGPGPGRNDYRIGFQLPKVGQWGIVPNHDRICTKSAEGLSEVVDERVEVVD
jgi:hypothetical protein